MNWLFWAVCIVFFLFITLGIVKGFIKIIVSLTATIITVVIVFFATPYVGDVLGKFTPLDDIVQKKCVAMMTPNLKDIDLSAVELEGVDLSGGDLSQINLTIEQLLAIAETVEIPKDTQIKTIKETKMPEFFKTGLLNNNNSAVYEELKVKSFPQYVGVYMGKVVVNIVAFILTFILVTLIVRIVMYAIGFIGELPVIHGINRLAGGVLGMVTALLVVWIVFMGLSLAYDTPIGIQCMAWIQESAFLSFLNKYNLLMQWIMGAV